MKILTARQMREMDRLTVERCGISYAVLMETAGSRVVEEIIKAYGPVEGKSAAVFCGKGNNGGDGAVIARHLWMRGASRIEVYLFGRLDEIRGEAHDSLEAVRRIAKYEADETPISRLSFREIGESLNGKPIEYSEVDLVIDALLGTGLTRPAEGLYEGAIEWINRVGMLATLISVDIPSGLSSDSGELVGPHVRANMTVSFTAPKIGNVLPPACYTNGRLVIASIGTPSELLKYDCESDLEFADSSRAYAALIMSRRTASAHKGTVGDVLLIAGSRGKTGAAALASEAVLRAGAGLVTVATAGSAQSLLVAQARAEVMTEPLDELSSGAISHAALDRALELAESRKVIALGPGLSSREESTRRFVREFVERRPTSLVIDADGLNALAPWPADLRGDRERPIIITPHPGEMARLVGKTTAEVLDNRIDIARDFAADHQAFVVLKGNRTIVASPRGGQVGGVFVNSTGNAGMATAGSGDVLTGLIAGIMAQLPQSPLIAALEAALTAVYLHGLAGDMAAKNLGLRSMIASDLLANLSDAILEVGGISEREEATFSIDWNDWSTCP